jgi:hypothetical protein
MNRRTWTPADARVPQPELARPDDVPHDQGAAPRGAEPDCTCDDCDCPICGPGCCC